MNFVAIDFETANPDRYSVCSMGIAVVENNEIVDQRYWLIRPPVLDFDPWHVEIHGITAEDVINKPTFDKLWPEIKSYIENKTILAHFASFDMSVLRHTLTEYEIEFPDLSYSCSWIISKRVWPGLPSYRLPYVANHLGIEFNHHHAGHDAFACASITASACKQVATTSIDELAQRLDFRNGRIFPGGYRPASEAKWRDNRAKDIIVVADTINECNPFFGKGVVFTGTLQSMVRRDAMQKVANAGGICLDNLTEKANYLVMGIQDYRKFTDGQKSSKLKKAESLIAKNVKLEILTEDEFLKMFD